MVARTSGRSLKWAIRVLYAEAVVAGAVTVLTIWLAIAAANVTVSSAIATAGFALICTGILAGLAYALAHAKSLARGPSILIQFLLIVIGGYMIAGGLAWLGIPVLIIGLLGAGLLLAPSTRASLGLG